MTGTTLPNHYGILWQVYGPLHWPANLGTPYLPSYRPGTPESHLSLLLHSPFPTHKKSTWVTRATGHLERVKKLLFQVPKTFNLTLSPIHHHPSSIYQIPYDIATMTHVNPRHDNLQDPWAAIRYHITGLAEHQANIGFRFELFLLGDGEKKITEQVFTGTYPPVSPRLATWKALT